MKKLTALLLSVLILISAIFSASAVQNKNDNKTFSADDWEYTLLSDNTAEITKYLGNSKSVEIPNALDNHTVTSIGITAFYNSKIEQITFADSIDKIGWWSFYNCKKLNSVTLNRGLQTIEFGAFMNCTSLKTITLPSTVNIIGEDAFAVSCISTKDYKDIYSKEYISRQNYKTDNEFIISGYGGTYSEKYANDNNLVFEKTDDINFADSDLNGKTDNKDIILIKNYLDDKAKLSTERMLNSDVDCDGKITVNDADLIDKYIDHKISYYEFPATVNLKPEYNYLDGKTMYCDGDSVAQGVGTKILGNDFYSYCNYVTDKHNMNTVNKSVSGTTLAKQDDKKGEKKSILERIKEMKGDYDVVLFEGGFNDLFQNIEIGEVTDADDKSGKYDEYTTAGALESICYFLDKNYKDSIKLFVICHTITDNEKQNRYWDTIRQVLDKWKIEYVDISTETDFCNPNDEIATQYFKYKKAVGRGDAIHPLRYANEKIYGPLVSQKLNSLAQKDYTIKFAEDNIQIATMENYSQQPVLTSYDDDTSVTWTSDNPNVAVVDENGDVTSGAIGSTVIRATAEDGNTAEYRLDVRMMALDLQLDKKVINLKAGESYKLKTSAFTGITSQHKTFKSTDNSIAFVNAENGIITANKTGKVVISCKASNGVKAECTVIVNELYSA